MTLNKFLITLNKMSLNKLLINTVLMLLSTKAIAEDSPAATQEAPKEFIAKNLPFDMVFYKEVQTRSQVLYNTRFTEGGNLFILRKNGTVENMTHLEKGDVSDPRVSYDADSILFSMMRNKDDFWHIWEMKPDGTGLKQLTTGEYDSIDPCFLPDGRIVFTSNKEGTLNEYEMQFNELLHIMDADGSNMHQISFFLSGDYNPMVLHDGRLLWMRYEHQGKMDFFPLVAARPDGTKVEEFFGIKGPIKVFHEFTQMPEPDGRVIATTMWHFYTWEGGSLVSIDPRVGPIDYAPPTDLTPLIPSGSKQGQDGSEPSKDGRYRTPEALADGTLLASWAPGPVSSKFDVGLYLLSPEERKKAKENAKKTPDYGLWAIKFNEEGTEIVRDRMLYNDPKFADLEPKPIIPRKRPPNMPSTYDPEKKFGEFLCLDVYENSIADRAFDPEKGGILVRWRVLDEDQGPIKRGDIKAVRVVEGIPVYAQGNTYRRASHYHHEVKRILGEVPVYEDGSFRVKVPTEMPIHFQTLDKDGRVLSTQLSWIYLQPGENNICIGCHEKRGFAPSNLKQMVEASKHPATVLDVPEEKRELYHFARDVYPILRKNCIKCHDGNNPAGEIDLSDDLSPTYTVAYTTLLPWIRPGSVRKCELTRMMQTKRKVGKCGMPIAPIVKKRLDPDALDNPTLSDKEWDIIAKWIELGLMYRFNGDGQTAAPFTLEETQKKIHPIMKDRGCMSPSCHGDGGMYLGAQYIANYSRIFSDSGGGAIIPIEISVNITNPERSRLLKAPRLKKRNHGLTREQREASLELFTKKCMSSCHAPNMSYYCDLDSLEKWQSTIDRMCNGQFSEEPRYPHLLFASHKKGMKNPPKIAPEARTVLAKWLDEFAGRDARPTCPNVWTSTEDEDYKKILTFLQKATETFIGDRNAETAMKNRCAYCHKDDIWKEQLNKKDSHEWKMTIMRMVQEQRWGDRPSWGIRPPEAAIIHDYIVRTLQKGEPLPEIPEGETAQSLFDKARTLRYENKIDEALLNCHLALKAGTTDPVLERYIRLEMGTLYTQYGYPAISEEIRKSRFIPRQIWF